MNCACRSYKKISSGGEYVLKASLFQFPLHGGIGSAEHLAERTVRLTRHGASAVKGGRIVKNVTFVDRPIDFVKGDPRGRSGEHAAAALPLEILDEPGSLQVGGKA